MACRVLLSALRRFLATPGVEEEWPSTVRSARQLLKEMEKEGSGDVATRTGRKRKAGPSVHHMQMRVRYQKMCRKKAETALQQQLAARVDGALGKLWIIRVGLLPVGLPLRAVSSVCQNFARVETPVISHSYVASVKNAMAELLKRMNAAAIAKAALEAPAATLYLSHVHDEALMRIRSYRDVRDDRLSVKGGEVARARSSKVQNNVVEVSLAGQRIEVLQELQALAKKDANTLAHALRQVVWNAITPALQVRPSSSKLRLVHLLIGDAISTNHAAALRLFKSLSGHPRIEYRLLVRVCASHQAKIMPNSVKQCQIVANSIK